jgi:hypothetical protein
LRFATTPSKFRWQTSLNRSIPRPSTYFPQITSGNPLFSISARSFSFRSDKRKLPQIAAVQVQQIERVKCWTATTKKQFVEDTPAFRIQADEFAINHCVLHFQLCEIVAQVLETFVRVSLPRDQFALSIPDVRQRSETVVLQLEEKIIVVEWGSDEAELRGVEAGWVQETAWRG